MTGKLIDLGNKVECLIAKREPVCVALYQPAADLTMSDAGGPNYASNREAITAKISNFLHQANEIGSQLIILPEFSTPINILVDICEGTLKCQVGTFLVLPLESLLVSDYQKLNETIGKTCLKMVLGELGKSHAATTWVNSCAIIAITEDGIEVYVQPKRYESNPEFGNLCRGDDYFVFKGDGLSLSVFICADANDSDTYLEQFNETRKCTRGAYFIHTQWNPKPQHGLYDDFWKRIILTDNNILISLNMAINSKIQQGCKMETIPLSCTRVACSGDAKRDEKYMSAKIYTAFKSIFRDKSGLIFNLAYPSDSCHFLVLRRPYENVSDAVNQTNNFLLSSQMFLSDNGTFVECMRENIASSFINYLFKINTEFKDIIIDQIKSLTFEEIEMFIASCLQEEKYTWLKKDILERPFIWSTFFSSLGIPGEYSKNSMDLFITTLKKIDQYGSFDYRIMPFEKISRYPINLISTNNDSYGWIFNCRGLSDVRISEDVSKSLLAADCIRKGSTITLFPTNCTAAFNADVFEKNILNAARRISDPTDNLSQDFDVTSPETRPRIRVNVL